MSEKQLNTGKQGDEIEQRTTKTRLVFGEVEELCPLVINWVLGYPKRARENRQQDIDDEKGVDNFFGDSTIDKQETHSFLLGGSVLGHPSFEDGTFISTSLVTKLERLGQKVVKSPTQPFTLSGETYKATTRNGHEYYFIARWNNPSVTDLEGFYPFNSDSISSVIK